MAPPAFRLDQVTAPSQVGPAGPSSSPPSSSSVQQVRLGVLLGVTGPATGVDHHVGLVPIRLGRDPSCQIQLRDEDVSSVHATITRTPEGDFELLDADSTNGTRVNGASISRAVLKVGDRISIGSSTLEFRFFEPGERSPKRTRKIVSEPKPVVVQAPVPVNPFALNASSSPGVATHVPNRGPLHGRSAGVLALLISFGTIVAAGFGGFWWSQHASISARVQRAVAARVAVFRSPEPLATAETSGPASSAVPSARVAAPRGPR